MCNASLAPRGSPRKTHHRLPQRPTPTSRERTTHENEAFELAVPRQAKPAAYRPPEKRFARALRRAGPGCRHPIRAGGAGRPGTGAEPARGRVLAGRDGAGGIDHGTQQRRQNTGAATAPCARCQPRPGRHPGRCPRSADGAQRRPVGEQPDHLAAPSGRRLPALHARRIADHGAGSGCQAPRHQDLPRQGRRRSARHAAHGHHAAWPARVGPFTGRRLVCRSVLPQ